MKKYSDMSKEELLTLKAQLDKEYADIKAKGLALDMSRGKPSADQLDLSMGLMNVLSSDSDLKCETGVDCRKTPPWRNVRSRSGPHHHLRKLKLKRYV